MKELIKRVLKEETEDLMYIDTYWSKMQKRLDDIIFRIENELPKIKNVEKSNDSGLNVINYSDLGNSWETNGESSSLKALADKITHMIRTGKSDGVKRMLEKIATGRIKSLRQPGTWESEYLGKGHFRWNHQSYKLTDDEVKRVKEYFNL
jgi:hypothetical protein